MFLTCRLASFGHQGLFGHRPKKCVFECFRGQTEAGMLLFLPDKLTRVYVPLSRAITYDLDL